MDFNKFKDVENIKKEGIALWNDIVSEVKQLKNINGEKFKSGFNTYFVDYLKNDYVKFDGRVSRRQYWMFALYSMLISFVLGFVGGLIPFLSIISLLYVLAILVPSVGLGIRRLHDLNLSGWFFLICIIPFIGGIALVLLFCLPGDEKEKIAPLMRPVIDNLEQILDSDEKRRYEDEEELGDKITEIFERGIIQTEAMNFIRGRSIARTYLIIDEAQNMTPNQVKGIITRAGQGTKIILLGDPQQIDKPFLDERTNGLSYAAKHMIDSSLCWQITLSAEECERSALAMDAIKRL